MILLYYYYFYFYHYYYFIQVYINIMTSTTSCEDIFNFGQFVFYINSNKTFCSYQRYIRENFKPYFVNKSRDMYISLNSWKAYQQMRN